MAKKFSAFSPFPAYGFYLRIGDETLPLATCHSETDGQTVWLRLTRAHSAGKPILSLELASLLSGLNSRRLTVWLVPRFKSTDNPQARKFVYDIGAVVAIPLALSAMDSGIALDCAICTAASLRMCDDVWSTEWPKWLRPIYNTQRKSTSSISE